MSPVGTTLSLLVRIGPIILKLGLFTTRIATLPLRPNLTVDNIFGLPVIPVPGYPMMQQIASEQERGCIRLIQPRYQTHRQNA
jgi:hypothetical protein